MIRTTCTICSEPHVWGGRSDANAVCAGCAPNVAQALDRQLTQDQCVLPLGLLAQLETERQLLLDDHTPPGGAPAPGATSPRAGLSPTPPDAGRSSA